VTSAYKIAHDLAERSAMRPLAALCHFGLASAGVEIEGANEGSQSFNEARDAFRVMGMKYWSDQADRLFETKC
jgi:hypothetical protein